MPCPIFAQSEECFCLYENCRYYDEKNQKCMYGNNNINKPPASNTSTNDIILQKSEKTNKAKATRHEQNESKVKLSAKELWDTLSVYHHENGIPRYDNPLKFYVGQDVQVAAFFE